MSHCRHFDPWPGDSARRDLARMAVFGQRPLVALVFADFFALLRVLAGVA